MIQKQIVVLSATQGNNLRLAKLIEKSITSFTEAIENQQINPFKSKIVDILSLNLPLFSANENFEKLMPKEVISSGLCLIESAGIVIACPEYNGAAPPALINFVAWISVCKEFGKDSTWRECFVKKPVFLASHSSSHGSKVLSFMRLYFSHLGAIVISREFSLSRDKDYKELQLGLEDLFQLVLAI